MEGLWKDCGGVVALCSAIPSAFRANDYRRGRAMLEGGQRGGGDYLKLAESLVRQQS